LVVPSLSSILSSFVVVIPSPSFLVLGCGGLCCLKEIAGFVGEPKVSEDDAAGERISLGKMAFVLEVKLGVVCAATAHGLAPGPADVRAPPKLPADEEALAAAGWRPKGAEALPNGENEVAAFPNGLLPVEIDIPTAEVADALEGTGRPASLPDPNTGIAVFEGGRKFR
jgi:hypothetical protein